MIKFNLKEKKELKTPLFKLDLNKLINNYREFKKIISSEIYFAVKSNSHPNVLKTCNLHAFIKDDYSETDYVDSVHLSRSGHKKWAKYIKSCLNY